jgi:hypothetical protein
MNAFRKLLAIPLLVLTVLFAGAAAVTATHKLGNTLQLAQLEPYLPKMMSAEWWLVAIAGAAALFWLVSASSLLRGTRQAFIPFVIAFVATAAVWLFGCQLPNHGYEFAAAERVYEIAFFGGLAVLGALVALTDRRKRYKPDVTVE